MSKAEVGDVLGEVRMRVWGKMAESERGNGRSDYDCDTLVGDAVVVDRWFYLRA